MVIASAPRAFATAGRASSSRMSVRGTPAVVRASPKPDKGLDLLSWTGALFPQSLLVKGAKGGWKLAWQTMMKELAPQDASGAYSRPDYDFGGKIGDGEFPVQSGRYHLYVGNACPWCHRVMLALSVLGLDKHITYTWLLDDAERASRGGWVFDASTGLDPVFGAADLRQVYDAAKPGFRGRCTAPLLVDKQTRKLVCNESAIMLDNFYQLATELPGCRDVQLLPSCVPSDEMKSMNDFVYNTVNNGVYRSGFSTSQAAYSAAQADLKSGLEVVEETLSKNRFLMGEYFTDADLRLFPTIVRYDAVYSCLFKCTRYRIKADFPNIQAWMQDVWLIGNDFELGSLRVSDTYSVDAARNSYFGQLFPLNPGGIIPTGPTASDLKLGTLANRGSVAMDAVFVSRSQEAAECNGGQV